MLPAAELPALRDALADYTVDGVHDLLGPTGQAAHDRGDLAGVARVVRTAASTAARTGDSATRRLAMLIRMFLLGHAVDEADARAALDPLDLDAACAGRLVTASAGSVRALLDLRPIVAEGGPPAWVVSDFGSDVRPGPLRRDHVLGVGSASLTLAQATPRAPVGRALDLGTGCGVQALFLGAHAGNVVATDVSTRALRFAATSAALSRQDWDLRHGSLLEPVASGRFDLIVANPPFVVSAGDSGYVYRDSGLAGDAVSARLVAGLPDLLAPGGTAVLLANWVVAGDRSWDERVTGWVEGRGCDAWFWQREVADPGEYAALWLRDAGERPDTPRWGRRYDAWLDWFAASGVVAVGMGLVALFRPLDAATSVTVVAEHVPQAVVQPVGGELPAWVARQRWLARTDDGTLQASPLCAAPDVVLTRDDVLTLDGLDGTDAAWRTASRRLRQATGLCWDVEVDEHIASLVAACDGARPLAAPVAVLAAALELSTAEVAAAALPVVRDLIARGFLVPAGLPAGRPDGPCDSASAADGAT